MNDDQKETMSNEFYKEIQEFRQNPKTFVERKKYLKQKLRPDYVSFVNSLEKLPDIKLNQELCELAKTESEKFAKEEDYDPIQTSSEIKIELNQNFEKNLVALIAIDELKKPEELIPKIISHEKKEAARSIFQDHVYTDIGIGNYELDEINYLVLIFAKELPQEPQPKGSPLDISNIENSKIITYLEEINKFRENPKDFIEKKKHLQKKIPKTL